MITVLQSGLLNSIQDLGRTRTLRWGVSRSGAMDPLALKLGNMLVGNSLEEAGVEVAIFPFRVRFDGECPFAVTGAATRALLDHTPLPPDWATIARPGQVLTLAPPTRGVFGYICVAGGVDAPIVLGARATDLKSGFGGREGKALAPGHVLELRALPGRGFVPAAGIGLAPTAMSRDSRSEPPELRFIPAAEWDDFEGDGVETFLSSLWKVTRDVNRMGYRLSGPELRPRRTRELLSHGIVPGVIQVPPRGQPIVQMVEANTCGGYAKLGVIIDADLRLLAQMRSGEELKFRPVGWQEAASATRALDRQFVSLRTSLEIMRQRPQ